MKVADAYKTIDKIDEIKQVLYQADVEEGTHLTYDMVRRIKDLLSDYQNFIFNMDVNTK